MTRFKEFDSNSAFGGEGDKLWIDYDALISDKAQNYSGRLPRIVWPKTTHKCASPSEVAANRVAEAEEIFRLIRENVTPNS